MLGRADTLIGEAGLRISKLEVVGRAITVGIALIVCLLGGGYTVLKFVIDLVFAKDCTYPLGRIS